MWVFGTGNWTVHLREQYALLNKQTNKQKTKSPTHFYLCIWMLCLHICLCTTRMQCYGGKKRTQDSLKLELQKIINCHLSVGNGPGILWKSSSCSEPRTHVGVIVQLCEQTPWSRQFFQRKTFNYGLAYSFRGLAHYYHGGEHDGTHGVGAVAGTNYL